MKKSFTILNWTIYVGVEIKKSNKKIFNEIADLIIYRKKNLASKKMLDSFEITLEDSKSLLNNIIVAKTSGRKYFHYVLKFKSKRKIINFLTYTLGKYERK